MTIFTPEPKRRQSALAHQRKPTLADKPSWRTLRGEMISEAMAILPPSNCL
jgi:hypothetical protein